MLEVYIECFFSKMECEENESKKKKVRQNVKQRSGKGQEERSNN